MVMPPDFATVSDHSIAPASGRRVWSNGSLLLERRLQLLVFAFAQMREHCTVLRTCGSTVEEKGDIVAAAKRLHRQASRGQRTPPTTFRRGTNGQTSTTPILVFAFVVAHVQLTDARFDESDGPRHDSLWRTCKRDDRSMVIVIGLNATPCSQRRSSRRRRSARSFRGPVPRKCWAHSTNFESMA